MRVPMPMENGRKCSGRRVRPFVHICLAVAITPEAMSDPGRYIELLLESFAELEQALLPKRPTPRKTARKKTTPKKPAKTKPAAKKAAGKSAQKRKRARSG